MRNEQFMNYINGVLVVDNTGTINYSVRSNPRFDFGKDEVDYSQIIGKKLLQVYSDINENNSTIYECLRTGKVVYTPHQKTTTYSGVSYTIENITLPIINAGKIMGAIELSKDITSISDIKKNKVFTPSSYKVPRQKDNDFTFDNIVTQDSEMLRIIEKAKKIPDGNSPVLIYGETGTGKELFVKAIRNNSNRKHKPFIVQNASSIPDNLFDSILFGTTRGSFTGAMDKVGLFEAADGGVLFLDEMNSMPMHLQAKLLRVLQDGNIKRIGETKEKHVDVRLISAMNSKPSTMVKEGRLRADLFYRINVNSIEIPPLRKRNGDISLLTEHFIEHYNKEFGVKVKGVTYEVHDFLNQYSWPGNVRELQHVIESAMNLCKGEKITLDDLPAYLYDNIENNSNKPTDMMNSAYNEYVGYNPKSNLSEIMNSVEREIIEKKLMETKSNVSKAAKLLGIPRQTLQYKIQKHNIVI